MGAKIYAELTDTFGGEANYCWVKRVELELPNEPTQRQVLAEARRALELPIGLKLKLNFDSHGLQRYNVIGACVCLFIETQY